MLLAVNIVIGFGILLNLSIYAYQKGVRKPMSIPIWIAIVWILALLGTMTLISSVKKLCKTIKKVGLANWYESWIYK